jgi:glucose-6-phosphate isomerase
MLSAMSIESLLKQLAHEKLPSRIWRKETQPFAGPDAAAATHDAIRNRLGWLEAPLTMPAELAAVDSAATAILRDGLTDIYLLGMGGSSLCAEVLRDVLGSTAAARLVVLDTTDERTIRQVTDGLVAARSCFIVASKSGNTIEVTSLERHFRMVMAECVPDAGRHFVAITDPETALAVHAAASGYRHIFINPPDIGGRYSALSLFGLLPAMLTGVDTERLLASGQHMADQCRLDDVVNPGLALGAFMGGWAKSGRDKLTLLLPPSLAPLGPWIEQLVAESTGKRGRGILPIVGEPVGRPDDYGRDRAFVAMLTQDGADVRQLAGTLHAAGHPIFPIETVATDLGAEFFRWAFATAVAGVVLAVNPFDEPDVRSAKDRTQAQLDVRKVQGRFRTDPPFEAGPGYSRREFVPDGDDQPAGGRYVAMLDYLPAEPGRAAVVERLRANLRRRTGLATTHGIGPRYLHSTGQFHKGGPNTGIFLLMTAADQTATPVPDAGYTFSALKQAQAFGDFDALVAARRRVIHYHIDDANADFAAELEKVALGLARG